MRPIWDDLRLKVERAKSQLPEGIIGPFVNDEFGDVFGIIVTLTGEGYSYAELKEVADEVRDELLLLKDFESIEDLRRTVIKLPDRKDVLFLEDLTNICRGYIDPPGIKNEFVRNLIEAIVIVILIMLIFLGFRTGIIVSAIVPKAMIMAILIMFFD